VAYYDELKFYYEDYGNNLTLPGYFFNVHYKEPSHMIFTSDGESILINKRMDKDILIYHVGKVGQEENPEDLTSKITFNDYVKSFYLMASDKTLYIFTLTEDQMSTKTAQIPNKSDIFGKIYKLNLDKGQLVKKHYHCFPEVEIKEYLGTSDGRNLYAFPVKYETYKLDYENKKPKFMSGDSKWGEFTEYETLDNFENGIISPNGRIIVINTDVDLVIKDIPPIFTRDILEGNDYFKVLATFPNINGKILTFTPDARKLVAGDTEGKLYIISMESLNIEKTINGHDSYVKDIKVSPDSNFFLSVGNDNEIKMWDIKTGNLLSVFPDVLPIISDILPGGFFASAHKIYGDLLFKIVNIEMDIPITTSIRMFNPNLDEKGLWEDNPTARCPWCWKRFQVKTGIIKKIEKIEKIGLKAQDYSDPDLITRCPYCNKKTRINPFQIDSQVENKT
jgi:WD40 repeat protein